MGRGRHRKINQYFSDISDEIEDPVITPTPIKHENNIPNGPENLEGIQWLIIIGPKKNRNETAIPIRNLTAYRPYKGTQIWITMRIIKKKRLIQFNFFGDWYLMMNTENIEENVNPDI